MTKSESSSGKSLFEQKVEARRRKREEQLAALREKVESSKEEEDLQVSSEYADVIPTDDDDIQAQENKVIDKALSNIDIITAYRKWCNKSNPQPRPGQTESIMISCPVPGHLDKNPSAWINTDKQTWYCAACDKGGDKYDIAAFNFGIDNYKDGANFHLLRKQMLESIGYTFLKAPGVKQEYVIKPQKPQLIANLTVAVAEPKEESNVVSLVKEEDEDEPNFELMDFATLDWRSIVPQETFIDTYMQQCIIDDVPEEYHFWNALLAVGFALGKDTTLFDSVPVFGNLFICIIGPTGSGKSKARYHLDKLLDSALPHDWNDPLSKGTRRISSPASAEALVHSFYKPVTDPTNPKNIMFLSPVRGLIDFNELSALVGRANRMGNVLKPTMMQFYDMDSNISTVSRTHGVNEAQDPYASALTTTQPRSLKELITLGDSSSGFLNRWCFIGGTYKKRFAVGGAVVDINPAIDPLKNISGWSAMNKQVQWSKEALDNFTEFFHAHIEPTKLADDSGLLARLDLTMKKVILLLSANKMDTLVTSQTVDEAKIVFKYLVECFGLPMELIGSTVESEIHEAIKYQIKNINENNKNKGASIREIQRNLARRKYPLNQIVKVLKLMTEIGEIEVVPPQAGQRGRPTIKYRYAG